MIVAYLSFILLFNHFINPSGFKGSSDQIHFSFDNNVGKSQVRHRTTLIFELRHFNRFGIDLEIHHSISESLYVGSDPFRH